MSEEEKTLKYLSAMRVIDFDKLGFVYGKETITEILNLIQSQQKEIYEKEYLYKKALNDLVKAEKENKNKDKIIDEMAVQVYLTKEQREEMKEYIWISNKPRDFKSFVKQYFEKKVEGSNVK